MCLCLFPESPTSSTADSKCQLARPALTNCLLPPNPHAFLGPPKKQKSFKLSCLVQFPQERCTPPKPIVPTRTLSNQARSNPTSTITPQATEGSNFEAPLWTDSTPKKDLGEAFSYSLIRIGSRGSVSRMLRATKKKPKNIC